MRRSGATTRQTVLGRTRNNTKERNKGKERKKKKREKNKNKQPANEI